MNFSTLHIILAGLIALSQGAEKFSCEICQNKYYLEDRTLFGTDDKVVQDPNCKAKGGPVKNCDEIIPNANMCITIEGRNNTDFLRSCVNKEKLLALDPDIKINTCHIEKSGTICTCSASKCNPDKPMAGKKSSGSPKLMAPAIILIIFFAIKI